MSKKLDLSLIEQNIYVIRGEKVMLDSDLAVVYGITTKALKRAVKRNRGRFPKDFMFQLNKEEARILIFQNGISSLNHKPALNRSQNAIASQNLRYQIGTSSWGGRRYLPYAFTEHGAVMLASVLKSKMAIEASIQVVRAFIQLRSILAAHKELAEKIEKLSASTDNRFKAVFELFKKYTDPKIKPTRKIGFQTEKNYNHETAS